MRLLFILGVVWLLGTCRAAPPKVPDAFLWTTWTNAAGECYVEVPDVGPAGGGD